MTSYDFDTVIDRKAVPTLKTHRNVVGEDGGELFAAGVADMDFAVAPAIQEAVAARLSHGVFGYEALPEGLIPALCDWQARRHHWSVDPDHVLRAPNALNALAIATRVFSAPGDGVVILPPVFFDFFDVIRDNGRRICEVPLLLEGREYRMDFDALGRAVADPRTTILFLCNPHNPMGRVWRHDELERLAALCAAHSVLIVSDELHADLVHPGHRHVPIASLSAESAANSVTILSPAKSFNIAGCCSAFTVIPDGERREKLQAENARLTVNKNNVFANAAMEAAYRAGAPWLDAAIAYLRGNLDLVKDAVRPMPGVDVIPPQAGFLVWLNFRGLSLADTDLHRFLREKAGWAVTRGTSFGTGGAGFMRLNIACPRSVLEAGLDDLRRALEARRPT